MVRLSTGCDPAELSTAKWFGRTKSGPATHSSGMETQLAVQVRERLHALWNSSESDKPAANSVVEVAPENSLKSNLWVFAVSHLTAIITVTALALGLTAWWVLSARSTPVSSAQPAPSISARAASISPSQLVVHVVGAVAAPAVVTVTPGSRVQEALGKAGGPVSGADLSRINLAAPVRDGAQILVPSQASSTAANPVTHNQASAAEAGEQSNVGETLINLNTATATQLDALPGVGPVTASHIIAWREAHGDFSRIEQLQEIDGIGAKTFAQLQSKVCI